MRGLMDKNVLGVITARGSSKRIPRKNIRSLLAKPLLEYTLEAARQSKLLTRVILSSDDDGIINLARRRGVEVPFQRPDELARDDTPSIDVVIHAVNFMERQGFSPDIVVILEPTSPLRQSEDIDNALRIHIETDADSVVAVTKADHWHPLRAKKIENGVLTNYYAARPEQTQGIRRQDLPPAYFINGAFYSVKRDVLINEYRLYGRITRPYIMPPERSVDINEEIDFRLAEALLKCH